MTDRAAQFFLLKDFLRGLGMTTATIFREPATINYPFEKVYRGAKMVMHNKGYNVVTNDHDHGCITFEKKKFLIPNVCEAFGVAWMNTFDMLYKLEARFVLPV